VDVSVCPEQLLACGISEGGEHVGRLLELYRNYLRLLAQVEIGRRLQAKVDASDLVQGAMLEAPIYLQLPIWFCVYFAVVSALNLALVLAKAGVLQLRQPNVSPPHW
jgi:hypothetical protein